jgi:hypothetical protein
MIEFKHIPQNELRKWWPTIRNGLDEIKSYSPENWIPEDIYTDCFNKASDLFVVIRDGHFAGFFVLQPAENTVHVWAAWTVENDYQIVDAGLKYVKSLASQVGAKYLAFSSHRKGWQKRAAKYGFRPKQYICEV